MPPHCWMLTETPPEPGEVRPHMNILARKNFRLVNPDDDRQALYCYCDLHHGADLHRQGSVVSKPRWQKRYGSSQQANAALLAAWIPRDGWSDEAGTVEDLVATCARIFREASARERMDKTV